MVFLTVLTNPANKPLSLNEVDAGGYQEWFNSHVHKSRDSRGSIVGVEGGKYEVARERGLDCNLGSFEVTNLADQDNVGILTKEGTQRRGEVQANLFFHLYLVNARQIELNRILSGHNVRVDRIQRLQGGIKRIGFTAAGRAGHQHHAVRLGNVPLKFHQRLGLEAEILHCEHEFLFIEQTKHNLFPEQGRHRRDAKVEFAATQ